MTIYEAIGKDLPLLSPDGSECRVIKLRAGKARLVRLTKNGMLQKSGWVQVESLKLKPSK